MAKAKLAGQALNALKSLFAGQSNAEIALRLAPDIGFGVLEGVLTPGDLGDKIIAGGTSGLGGAAGGLLLGKLGGKNPMLTQALDMAGSIGGDFAGRAGGDLIMRGKDKLMGGEGQNPYERLNAEQQEQFAESVRAQLLSEMGLLPTRTQQYLVDADTSGYTG